MDNKEEMNEQKDRKTDKKKGKKKRLCLSILILIVLLFVPLSAYASEIKSDGKTTQGIEEENKTVRVGYFPYANFQEGGYGEHKQGAGYEYLQKISYIIGWKYEYVYGSFKECLDMLADGSYQKSVGPSGWMKIPIIAMTANAFAEDVQAALNAGMDDHVAKPVDMEIITSVITKYVER